MWLIMWLINACFMTYELKPNPTFKFFLLCMQFVLHWHMTGCVSTCDWWVSKTKKSIEVCQTNILYREGQDWARDYGGPGWHIVGMALFKAHIRMLCTHLLTIWITYFVTNIIISLYNARIFLGGSAVCLQLFPSCSWYYKSQTRMIIKLVCHLHHILHVNLFNVLS